MPGTIQVSDFAGSHSSSPDSQMSIKVSMGKREYQTWEKGEFSFPLMSMRDNLFVVLQDQQGNEVSRSEVETRLVIEKGVWDNVFPFEGGGHVHMNLQFVLNEEDREKIRATRQLALRKKREELLSKDVRNPAVATTNAGTLVQPKNEVSVTSSRDPKHTLPRGEYLAHLFKKGKRSPEDIEAGYSLQKQARPNNADIHEATSSTSHARNQLEKLSLGSAALERQPQVKVLKDNEPERKNSLERTSSNVRNMINVFESKQQDVVPRARSPTASTTSQSSKEKGKASLETGSDEGKITGHRNQVGFLGALSRPLEKDVQSERTEKGLKSKNKVKYKDYDNKERSSTGQRASVSGRMPDDPSSKRPFSNFFSTRRHSGGNLLMRRGGEGTKPRGSSDIGVRQVAGDEHYFRESSGAWIFPDEGRLVCITTAGKTIMNLTGDSQGKKVSYTEAHLRKENSVHGAVPAELKDPRPVQPGVENPAHGEATAGPLGQVIKVAIIVGFATLVVLTRQRNPDR